MFLGKKTQRDWGLYSREAVNPYGVAVATSVVCVGGENQKVVEEDKINIVLCSFAVDSCGGEPIAGGNSPPLINLITYPLFVIKWTQVSFNSNYLLQAKG